MTAAIDLSLATGSLPVNLVIFNSATNIILLFFAGKPNRRSFYYAEHRNSTLKPLTGKGFIENCP